MVRQLAFLLLVLENAKAMFELSDVKKITKKTKWQIKRSNYVCGATPKEND